MKTAPGFTNPENKAQLAAISFRVPFLQESCPRHRPSCRAGRPPRATPPPRAAFTCQGRLGWHAQSWGSRRAGLLSWPRRRRRTPRAHSHRQSVPGLARTGTRSCGPYCRQGEHLAQRYLLSPPPPGRRTKMRVRKGEPQSFSFRTILPRRLHSTALYGVREGPTVGRLESC